MAEDLRGRLKKIKAAEKRKKENYVVERFSCGCVHISELKLNEKKWSMKYKRSIDCSNPKGFSQKAHCAGRKKRKREDIMSKHDSINEYIVENYYDYVSFIKFMKENYVGQSLQEAEYQGRKVELGKVKRGGDKKFFVYVRDPQTKNIKKVSFGDTTGLSIKTKDPDRRRNFRARHNCDNPGPKTKARYWSCRMWSGPNAIKNMLGK